MARAAPYRCDGRAGRARRLAHRIRVANKTMSSKVAEAALEMAWHEERSAMNCAKHLNRDCRWQYLRARGGRPRVDNRAALNGMLFVLPVGIPGEALPQEPGLGSGMTCWRRLRDWQSEGVWGRLHLALLRRLREHDQIDWSRACIDGASVSSPRRTDWPKPHGSGQTRQQASPDCRQARRAPGADGHGAIRHVSMVFEALVDAIPSVPGLRGRPRCRSDKLHADKGYDFARCRQHLHKRGIIARMARRGRRQLSWPAMLLDAVYVEASGRTTAWANIGG